MTEYAGRRRVLAGESGLGVSFRNRLDAYEWYMVNGLVNGTASSGSAWDGNWTPNTDTDQFWYHAGAAHDGGNARFAYQIFNYTMNKAIPLSTTANNTADGAGGGYRVRPSVNQSGLHNVALGQFSGQAVTFTEYTPNGLVGCSNGSWNLMSDSISRWATPGNGSAVSPSANGTFNLTGH